MLYRRTPELPPLRSILNGELQDAVFPPEETSNISAGEMFPKSLWLETSLTKDDNCRMPATGSKVRTIFSRKYNVDSAFTNSLNELCATLATIHDLSASMITSEYMSATSVVATVTETDNMTAIFSDISVLNSEDISSQDLTATTGGRIDNISGWSLQYDNGTIDEFQSRDISTENITATGIADLSAAATYWADLAELYRSSETLEPGTLVKFNGNNEIEIASDGIANGVISKNPALLMNLSIKNDGASNPLVLVGRSIVKINGKIGKFDRIELSDMPGIAQKSSNHRKVLGISLETKIDDAVKPVECVVKLTI